MEAVVRYLHTMIRVSNLDQSLDFFIKKLGFVEQRRYDNEKGRFTLVFLAPPGDPKARALRVRLGDALANAGRGAIAALAYSKAAAGAPPAEALELRRRASEQYLRAGRFDQGLAAVQEVLSLLGLTYPRSALHALVQLLVLRLVLVLRGTRFKERDPSMVPARDLMCVDVCWSVAFSLALSDHIFGAVFQARAVLFALRAGEPTRVARALAVAAGYQATGGRQSAARVERHLTRARVLAESTRDPQSIAYTIANSAICHYLTGRFRHALEDCDRAATMFRDRVPGTAWEQATMHHFALISLACLGDLAELRRRQPVYLRNAFERGDLYSSMSVRIGWGNLVWLVRDDPDGARRDIEEATRGWSKEACHLEHFYELGSLTNADLYQGRAREALARVQERLPALRRAMLLRIGTVRLWTTEMRGRCALAVAARSPAERRALLASVQKDARVLERGACPWAEPMARLLRGAVASMRGDLEGAVLCLRQALYGFEAADMALYANAARARLAARVGGDEAAALRAQIDAWMKAHGVAHPERLIAMVTPGYDDAVNAGGGGPVESAREGGR